MRLLLMRHANTEKPKSNNDFELLLTARGKLEAAASAKFLHEYQIDKMLVSYAKRTIQTSSIIQEQVTSANLEIVTELYNSNQDMIINLLSSQEDHNKHILVIGHNPLIYDVALTLAERNSAKYELLIDTAMPTGRVIVIDFPKIDSWKDIHNAKGNIIEVFTPDITHN